MLVADWFKVSRWQKKVTLCFSKELHIFKERDQGRNFKACDAMNSNIQYILNKVVCDDGMTNYLLTELYFSCS